eukprot:5081003-Alexandrium_andersonii.AAC.1
MSASLVGSEMCIRDSALVPLGVPRLLRECCAHTNGALERKPKGRDPVSYTHLTLPTICSV